MKQRLSLLTLAMLPLLLVLTLPAQAQSAPESGGSAVYAIFYYSPTCPHCHIIIDDHLPDWRERFGDQLRLLSVDISTQGGYYLALEAVERHNLGDSWGVPMLIVGDTLLRGSVEIPREFPAIVENGLAKGGIPLPEDMTRINQAYQASFAANDAPDTGATSSGEAAGLNAQPGADATVLERLSADPIANGVAVVVLVGLMLSLGTVLAWTLQRQPQRLRWNASPNLFIVGGAAVIALGVGLSLVTQGTSDPLAALAAWSALGLMIVAGGGLLFRETRWVFPLVAVTGLIVAAYLAYVEVTQVEAMCGAVGNCNAVQQSAYASFLGVPVGVWGILGYALILVTWLIARTGHRPARILLLVLTLGGTAFSAYLTFLEPFVIGATCAWCLMSALTMLLLLWLAAPEGLAALTGAEDVSDTSFNQLSDGARLGAS